MLKTVVRRRLAALAYAATHTDPTIGGWIVLHTLWRSLEGVCAGDPELASEWRRVDALLGGFGPNGRLSGSGARNVKGQFSAGSIAENCLRSGLPLTGRPQNRMTNVRWSGRQFGRLTNCPAASDAVAVAVCGRWVEK